MQALAFTSDDLTANRAGHLSDGQRARLCFVYRSLTTSKHVIWIAVGFVAVQSLLWFGFSFVSRNFDLGTVKGILVEALMFAAFVLWVRHRERAALHPDPEESQVLALEGDVKCGSQPTPRSLMQLFYVEMSLGRLASRWFVMRDVYLPEGAALLQPRWTMSFMKGPMTGSEIRAARNALRP